MSTEMSRRFEEDKGFLLNLGVEVGDAQAVIDAPPLQLVNESGGFAPTRKYHYAAGSREPALCGATPSAMVWNVTVSDRSEFERLVPERICSNCKRKEQG